MRCANCLSGLPLISVVACFPAARAGRSTPTCTSSRTAPPGTASGTAPTCTTSTTVREAGRGRGGLGPCSLRGAATAHRARSPPGLPGPSCAPQCLCSSPSFACPPSILSVLCRARHLRPGDRQVEREGQPGGGRAPAPLPLHRHPAAGCARAGRPAGSSRSSPHPTRPPGCFVCVLLGPAPRPALPPGVATAHSLFSTRLLPPT